MASNVEIANLALSRLGADLILAIDENTENGRKVNAIYEIVRDIMLAMHPWNFALKRVDLALIDETPNFGFDKVFQLPPDYLRVIKTDQATDVDYKIEGRKLYIDVSSVKIQYIFRVTDPVEFSPGFVIAFSDELAARLAYPIVGSRSVGADIQKIALLSLRVAKSQDAQEGLPDDLDANEWLLSRHRYGVSDGSK